MLGLIQSKIQVGRTTGGTITIDEVSDIAKCIVLASGGATAYLSTTTSLVVTRDTNNSNGTVDWQVIELGGAVGE